MSYGFDPSELIETKIDLIDKDGFHGVGAADDRNGGNATESSKVVFSIDEYNTVACIIYLVPKDYPEFFDSLSQGYSVYPYASALYTGESINVSEAEGDDEGGIIQINNKIIGAPFGSYNALVTKDFVCYTGSFITDYSQGNQNTIPLTVPKDIVKGETVHILLAYSWSGHPKADEHHNYFLQIDAPWTLDPSDFEE